MDFNLYYGAPDDRVHVWQTEENGSDVNLAARFLNDAWSGYHEVAALVSNDTDLVEAILLVQDNLNSLIGLIPPTVMPSCRSRKDSRVKYDVLVVNTMDSLILQYCCDYIHIG